MQHDGREKTIKEWHWQTPNSMHSVLLHLTVILKGPQPHSATLTSYFSPRRSECDLCCSWLGLVAWRTAWRGGMTLMQSCVYEQ